MRAHAFAQRHRQCRQRHQQTCRRLRHGVGIGTQIVHQSLPFQRCGDRVKAMARLAAKQQAKRADGVKLRTETFAPFTMPAIPAATPHRHVDAETGQFRHRERCSAQFLERPHQRGSSAHGCPQRSHERVGADGGETARAVIDALLVPASTHPTLMYPTQRDLAPN